MNVMMMQVEQLVNTLAVLLLTPLFAAIFNGLWGARLPRSLVGMLACGSVLVAFGESAVLFWQLLQQPDLPGFTTTLYPWVHTAFVNIEVGLLFDRLSGLLALLVCGVGFLVHVFSWGYMQRDPAWARYFACLNLFIFSMLVLVLADGLPLMFVGWEGVGLCSYLLIGFWYQDLQKVAAGKKAFVMNRIGDIGLLLSMLILWSHVGYLDFVGLEQAAESGFIDNHVATMVGLLLLLGATGKSAQLPLFTWLPDAMAGPTPVSALIHAATMVTAGVYLLARTHFVFALAPHVQLVVLAVGSITAFVAATVATVQQDIKKILAYSTISQLGFMFMAAGVGAHAVALLHVVTHAFCKACLFLAAGSVIASMHGEQDLRRLGGLAGRMPWTMTTFVLATMALTGFPLLSCFVSKDAILWQVFVGSTPAGTQIWHQIAWGIGVVTAGLTAFYMWRLVFLTFFGKTRPEHLEQVQESPLSMLVPLVVLATLAVFGGALSWPSILGGHEWLEHWLAAVVGTQLAQEQSMLDMQWLLMIVATGVALLGFVAAFVLYNRGRHPWLSQMKGHKVSIRLRRFLWNAWLIDALYRAALVRPLVWVSRVLLWRGVEQRVFDAPLRAVGPAIRWLGLFGQLLHNGDIQRYLAVFVIGAAVLLYGWLMPYKLSWPVSQAVPSSVEYSVMANTTGDLL